MLVSPVFQLSILVVIFFDSVSSSKGVSLMYIKKLGLVLEGLLSGHTAPARVMLGS